MNRVPRWRRGGLLRKKLLYIPTALLALPSFAADYFTPTNRLTAIGVDRKNLCDCKCLKTLS